MPPEFQKVLDDARSSVAAAKLLIARADSLCPDRDATRLESIHRARDWHLDRATDLLWALRSALEEEAQGWHNEEELA